MSARIRILQAQIRRSPNRILQEFTLRWDGSLAGVERFRDQIADRAEPSAVRDHAADVLEDLASAIRAAS